MVKLLGLIGYPLSHSFSESYFKNKFKKEDIQNWRYKNFPIDSIDKLIPVISENRNLVGLNVTITYKEKVIPYLSRLSAEVQEIKAVNTILIQRSDDEIITTGFNTDIVGFERSLKKNDVKMGGAALILGTGGASKAVEWVLRKNGFKLVFASRNPVDEDQISYEEITPEYFKKCSIIVNTTPLGMHPQIDAYPDIPYQSAHKEQTFFDLIYNPEETLFLRKVRAKGCKTINGLYMLEQQAERAFEIWNQAIDQGS